MSEEQGEYLTGKDELPQSKSVGEDYYTTASIDAQGKPIRCPECRQVIGHVVRRDGIRNLRVEVGGFAFELEGAANVWCCCGGLLVWHAGQEAIERLIEQVTNKE